MAIICSESLNIKHPSELHKKCAPFFPYL